MKDHYGVDDQHLDNIEKQYIDKRKLQYYLSRWVQNQSQEFVNEDLFTCWKNSYNSLKDPSWPDCSTPLDFEKLPDDIKEECRNVHKFSPEHWFDSEYENWIGDDDWKIPVNHLIKVNHVILDNLDIIKDKKIVDLACHLATDSFWALSAGAKSIKATNVRPQNIELVKEGAKLFGYEDKFEIIYSDLHDYSDTTKVCQGADTVLLCGIMYHVHDHYDIIKSIASASPENIIIETEEHPDLVNSDKPAVGWRSEIDNGEITGFVQGEKNLFVGLPNPVWFKFILEEFGYIRTNIQFYDRLSIHEWPKPGEIIDKDYRPQSGSVQVFKRLTSLDK